MLNKTTWTAIGCCLLTGLLPACKQEPPPPPPVAPAAQSQPAIPSAQAVARAAQETLTNVVQTVQTQAVAALQQVKVAVASVPVTNAVTESASAAQGLIDKLKAAVTRENYQEGTQLVQQISNLKLTPEQQQLFDSLKKQVQSLLTKQASSEASSALGNVLGGKK